MSVWEGEILGGGERGIEKSSFQNLTSLEGGSGHPCKIRC